MVILSRARCRLFAYGPADATAIPKPHRVLPHLCPDWFFTVRCYASAVLAMGLCHTNKTTRYLRDSNFLVLKIFAKFDRGHSLWGRQMQVGWVKIGDFRQIAGYRPILKTVQDRRMVSIEVEQEVVCALSNGDFADDLE